MGNEADVCNNGLLLVLKSLRDLIESMASDNAVKELIKARDEAKDGAKRLLEKYNNKLEKVIHDLRFCVW